jgi:LysR family transcriptional regulator, cell division regulator
MDIHDLKVFQMVAHEQSISKAAQKLNYVQSNVTARIKQLEEELQTTLFLRHGRGVQITSAGEVLLTYTEKILRMMDETVKAVQHHSRVPTGSLTLGATESAAAVRLPALLAHYCQSYTEVECSLETASTAQLVQSVVDYKLDGAFVPLPILNPELTYIPLWQEQLVWVNRNPDPPSLKGLTEETILVFGTGCTYRDRMEKWLLEEGITPKKIREFGSFETIIGCIEAGLGIGIMTQSLIDKYDSHSLYTHPIPEPIGKVTIAFIRRDHSFLSKAFEAFIQLMLKYKTVK